MSHNSAHVSEYLLLAIEMAQTHISSLAPAEMEEQRKKESEIINIIHLPFVNLKGCHFLEDFVLILSALLMKAPYLCFFNFPHSKRSTSLKVILFFGGAPIGTNTVYM